MRKVPYPKPGEILLEEFLQPMGISAYRLAKDICVPQMRISQIIAGILGLAYGGFSYTKDSTVVKIGTLEISAKEKKTVNVPMWAGIGAIVVGGLLLVMGSKKG